VFPFLFTIKEWGSPFLGDFEGVEKETGKLLFSLEANNFVDEVNLTITLYSLYLSSFAFMFPHHHILREANTASLTLARSLGAVSLETLQHIMSPFDLFITQIKAEHSGDTSGRHASLSRRSQRYGSG